MKKITLTAMVLAVACMFAACTKEGVYTPKEKISKVYESSSTTYSGGDYSNTETTAKHMTESWTWDGKLISSITTYDNDGGIDGLTTFTYDGKQLTEIKQGTNVSKLTYDGSKLQKIESYNGNELQSTITVIHDGKKIVQLEFESYDNDKKDAKAIAFMQTIMKVVMPVYTEKTSEMFKSVATKGTEKYTMDIVWDGKNVSKVTMTTNEGTAVINYTYDEMNNPYQGFVFALADPSEYGSKNNVVSETSTITYDGETTSSTTKYTYEYDGKWPTQQTSTSTSTYDILGTTYTYSYTEVTYFEYAD